MAATDLRERVIEILGDESVPVQTLRERLGPPWNEPVGRDDLAQLIQLDPTFPELDDGVVHLPTLVEGTRWSVYVDPDLAADDVVRVQGDLDAISWWLIEEEVDLVDAAGAEIGSLDSDAWQFADGEADVVCGPDGWLDEVRGGWAEFAVVDGAVRVSPLATPPAPTPRQIAAICVGFERATGELDQPYPDGLPKPAGLVYTSVGEPIVEALAVDRAAFRDDPIPPVAELYVAAGFEPNGSYVGAPGTDWDALYSWQIRNRLVVLYDLGPEAAERAGRLIEAYDSTSGDPVDASALDDGAVAAAWWAELHRLRDPATDDLEHFVDRFDPAPSESIGRRWLRARLLERHGDAVGAADVLEASVDDSCTYRPALLDLAGLRADRGDATGALRLLVRAGVEPLSDEDDVDDEPDEAQRLRDEVEVFAARRPRAMAGRNDPCPCGSGRKYKACHQGREVHPLDDRAGWLYEKAVRYLRTHRYGDAEQMAEIAVDPRDNYTGYRALRDSPVPADIVLHEDGGFAEFLAARDRLLPDDEALLAAQLTLVDRSVFEVVATTGGVLRLRDIRRGGEIRVLNVHRSDSVRPGMLLIGRPLPVSDGHRAFSGFLPVPLVHLDAMLAALDTDDAEVIAMAIGATFAPRRLANTDGHELLLHTTTWQVPDPAAVGPALRAAGLRDAGDSGWSLVRDSANQPDTVIATAELTGSRLTVEVNSRERAAELHDLIAATVPGAEVEAVDEQPVEMPEPGSLPLPESADVPDDPALRAAIVEHVAKMERRWLDESIPALGGRTPRDAAADPIGRQELVRLLASFPEPGPDDIGMMSVARLRAALGL